MKPKFDSLANSQATPYHQMPGASQGNAFTAHIRQPEQPRALTAIEKERAYQAAYARRHYVPAAQRNAAITAFKRTAIATFGAPTDTSQAQAKTARLVGRRNTDRSQ